MAFKDFSQNLYDKTHYSPLQRRIDAFNLNARELTYFLSKIAAPDEGMKKRIEDMLSEAAAVESELAKDPYESKKITGLDLFRGNQYLLRSKLQPGMSAPERKRLLEDRLDLRSEERDRLRRDLMEVKIALPFNFRDLHAGKTVDFGVHVRPLVEWNEPVVLEIITNNPNNPNILAAWFGNDENVKSISVNPPFSNIPQLRVRASETAGNFENGLVGIRVASMSGVPLGYCPESITIINEAKKKPLEVVQERKLLPASTLKTEAEISAEEEKIISRISFKLSEIAPRIANIKSWLKMARSIHDYDILEAEYNEVVREIEELIRSIEGP